jgi:hypothetical protein
MKKHNNITMKIFAPILVSLAGLQLIAGKQSRLRKQVDEHSPDKHLDRDDEHDLNVRRLQTLPLKNVGNNGVPNYVFPLGKCEGDCDVDTDCAGNLVCFKDNTQATVPGCSGTRAMGVNGYADYCVDTGIERTNQYPTPKPVPQSTEHDCPAVIFGPAILTPPDTLVNTIMEIQGE